MDFWGVFVFVLFWMWFWMVGRVFFFGEVGVWYSSRNVGGLIEGLGGFGKG